MAKIRDGEEYQDILKALVNTQVCYLQLFGIDIDLSVISNLKFEYDDELLLMAKRWFFSDGYTLTGVFYGRNVITIDDDGTFNEDIHEMEILETYEYEDCYIIHVAGDYEGNRQNNFYVLLPKCGQLMVEIEHSDFLGIELPGPTIKKDFNKGKAVEFEQIIRKLLERLHS